MTSASDCGPAGPGEPSGWGLRANLHGQARCGKQCTLGGGQRDQRVLPLGSVQDKRSSTRVHLGATATTGRPVVASEAGTDEDLAWCWARQAGRLGDEGIAKWVRPGTTVRPARSPEASDCKRLRTVGRTCLQSLADGWLAVAELCPGCTRRFMVALDEGLEEPLRWALAFRRTARRRTR